MKSEKLTPIEIGILSFSLVLVTGSSIFARTNPVEFLASAVGVVALIFVAKGLPIGQLLTVVFSLLYAIVSFTFHYWGEMITYLGMSMPIALFSFLSWLRHPYEEGKSEVKIEKLTWKKGLLLSLITTAVTIAFYFILRAFDTPNLITSTLSVTTSFFAASLLFLRSPFYALFYALNDIVLIVLWVFASFEDLTYLPMIACFVAFLLNDAYGFFNWIRMQKKQEKN